MDHCTPKPNAKGISLPVLPGSNPPRRASRMGWKRAAVLTAVWILMIAHLLQWLSTRDPITGQMGETLAPIEPSESMQTVKNGIITVGAIFFIAALASTALLGRWFCGWGCHWVAVQDATRWLLHKGGVRPKPFRSRLLVWVPFLLAFYMFLWPLVYRFAIAPWVQPQLVWPGFRQEYVTTDYWATFPGIAMAIPFTLVCGAVIIYLLGSKGYCTYACPYGGFFAPVEELAPMRIIVDADKCHQCGHCTAVCTSNVRVHEEVRDYGMVVDPGCMKCMDCVSVCPNNALSFGLGKPSMSVKREGTRAAAAAVRRYDLTWPEEITLLVLATLTFLAVRGNYLALPLLFASGLTMCVVFAAWKAWRIVRDQNSAFHQWQLRYHSTWRLAGVVWVGVTAGALVAVAYVGTLNGVLALAEHADMKVVAPVELVYADQRTQPPQKVIEDANAALRYYTLASMAPTGISVLPLAQTHVDMRTAWLQSVLGEFRAAEASLRRVWERDGASEELAAAIGRVTRAQSERTTDAIAWYEQQLALHPTWQDLRQEQIAWLQYIGENERTIASARAGLAAMPGNLRAMRQLSLALVEQGADLDEVAQGVELIRKTLLIEPRNGFAHAALGRGLLKLGQTADAVQSFQRAAELEPNNELIRNMLEEVKELEGNPLAR